MLLKTGLLADFKTGYLQIALIEPQCDVTGGTDMTTGADGGSGVTAGFAVGRLVKLVRHTDGSCHLVAPTALTSISDATHIVAQADDSLDTTTIKGEQLNFAAIGLLKNTATSAPDAGTAASATCKKSSIMENY